MLCCTVNLNPFKRPLTTDSSTPPPSLSALSWLVKSPVSNVSTRHCPAVLLVNLCYMTDWSLNLLDSDVCLLDCYHLQLRDVSASTSMKFSEVVFSSSDLPVLVPWTQNKTVITTVTLWKYLWSSLFVVFMWRMVLFSCFSLISKEQRWNLVASCSCMFKWSESLWCWPVCWWSCRISSGPDGAAPSVFISLKHFRWTSVSLWTWHKSSSPPL